ncbi:MAG TPA: DUF1471 domain-containing protein [Anaeromyxobacteraceae bacterium]|nr:DUF1471 domain-containing protein [Anaeromyxobacteraceae bacterium]
MRRPAIGTALWTALAAGCTYSLVQVTPSGPGVQAERRPSDCHVDFYRTKAPEQPYDEIAALHVGGGMLGAADVQEAIRAEACRLGAHAVVVTSDYRHGAMSGTAVVYRGFRASDAGQPDPPTSAARPPGPCPPGGKLLEARLRRAADLRDAAGGGTALQTLPEGTVVCATDWSERGQRQVRLEANRIGWVPEDALDLGR